MDRPLVDMHLPDWPGLPDDVEFDAARVVESLRALDGPADEAGIWPTSLWEALRGVGAHAWTLPLEYGGAGLGRSALMRRFAKLAEGSLTAAFILSQHDAAVRRLLAAAGRAEIDDFLRRIGTGAVYVTVGISHLTTSRRLGEAPMTATPLEGGRFRLEGAMPWVTGAACAERIVTGGPLPDGRQVLAAVPRDREGVEVEAPLPLAALQASCTAEVRCRGVVIGPEDMLAGPAEPAQILALPGLAGTGGLETSALALGLARAALVGLGEILHRRDEPLDPLVTLADAWTELADDLVAAADGRPQAPASTEIRRRANDLALRLTQAHLTARKGTGFLRTDPAQRWARQALFFLVWSCPTPVAQAAIRDLAGLCPS